MTSNKNKSNNSKNEDRSPGNTFNASGGGTSNAGNNSPADSSFSDGELLSPVKQDVKPIIDQSTEESFEQLAKLMASLSPHHQEQLMMNFAEHSGFVLSKPDRQAHYPEASQKVSDPNKSSGLFDGRDTPLNTGFTPHVTNFSQRQETTHDLSSSGTATSSSAGVHPSSYTVSPPPAVKPTFVMPHQPTTTPTMPTPSNPPAWAPLASAPGPTFPTGLALRANPRPDQYVCYETNRVIVPRDKRGNTDKDKVKMHEICTEGITPQITRGNIAKLLTSTDDSYDIASDAVQWQTALSNIWDHVIRFDYTHIVFIPTTFDPANPNSFGVTSTFVNSVLDHDQLTDNHYFSWQTLLRRFGQREELQSDGWFEDKLKNSLAPGLKAEVMSDFNELPSIQKGSISLLRLIINRIVQNSQESRRAMEDYIKTFDIRNFPGEDVTKASLRLKAVAQSLGTTRLPMDIVHRVLEGFALSSTPAFTQLCLHQKSMISSSLVKSTLRQDTLYKTLVGVISDLEVHYLELLSGHRWVGLGNDTQPSSAFFMNTDSDSDDSAPDEYDTYMAYTARAGHRIIPFETWVKDKICRNCHKVGHIQRDCPAARRLKSASYQSPKRTDNGSTRLSPPVRSSSLVPRSDTKSSSPSSKQDFSSKVKALLSAVQDLAALTGQPITPVANAAVTVDNTSDHNCDPSTDYSGFLAALGCPKE